MIIASSADSIEPSGEPSPVQSTSSGAPHSRRTLRRRSLIETSGWAEVCAAASAAASEVGAVVSAACSVSRTAE
jgi:hypothetical protein